MFVSEHGYGKSEKVVTRKGNSYLWEYVRDTQSKVAGDRGRTHWGGRKDAECA